MSIFDYDVTKIDPNLMKFFQSAEFSELIHKASDLQIGEVGQHHNLGLTPNDAAPGGVVKKLKTDLDDLTDTVDTLVASPDTWQQDNANLIPNGSFNDWDSSLISVPDLPDGLPRKWGNFWSTGTRGPITKVVGVDARDEVALKWTAVDPAGSAQRIYTEAIRLADGERMGEGVISCWLKSGSLGNPVKFSMDLYAANHDHPAPFDGTTTYYSVAPIFTVNHTDWRKYSFRFKNTGLQYYALFFSFWSDAAGGQVGYIDQCEFNNSYVSAESLTSLTNYAPGFSGTIPYGYNFTPGAGSKGIGVVAPLSGGDVGSFFLRSGAGLDPFWDQVDDNQVYRGFPNTVKDALDNLYYDGGSVTGLTGYTNAANWAIQSALYRMWSFPPVRLVHLRIVIQRTTSTLVIPVDGNISNIDVLTATPSGVAPPFAVGLSGYSTGPESQMLVQSDGSVQLGWVCPGANVVVGDNLSASGTYVVIA